MTELLELLPWEEETETHLLGRLVRVTIVSNCYAINAGAKYGDLFDLLKRMSPKCEQSESDGGRGK